MVVTWLEWSDMALTLHENRPGWADETRLGEVRLLTDGLWHWRTNAGGEGTEAIRQKAMEALKWAVGGEELE